MDGVGPAGVGKPECERDVEKPSSGATIAGVGMYGTFEKNYGEFRRKIRLWRACKTWFQATLDEAGTEHQSALE